MRGNEREKLNPRVQVQPSGAAAIPLHYDSLSRLQMRRCTLKHDGFEACWLASMKMIPVKALHPAYCIAEDAIKTPHHLLSHLYVHRGLYNL